MKKLSVLFLAAILTMAIATAGITGALVVNAESNPDALDPVPSISVTNGDFEESTSASNWTGAYGDSFSYGSYGGVIELAKINTSLKNYGFEEDEIASVVIPTNQTLDDKILFIHNKLDSVYKYTSAEISIPARSYVEITVDVLTQDFAESDGAYIRLTGELNEVSFGPINTKGQWKTVRLLVKSQDYKAITTTLSLQVGNDATDEATTQAAIGWAAFDNASATSLTRAQYNDLRETYYANHVASEGTVKAIDGLTKSYIAPEYESVSVSSFDKDNFAAEWKATEDNTLSIQNTSISTWSNVSMEIDGETKTVENPLAPLSAGEDNVLTFFGFPNDNNFGGMESVATVNVPRFSYVRLSVWVNNASVYSGTVTVAATVAENADGSFNADAGKSATVTTFTAQNTSNYTKDWAEAVILIKGSAFYDRQINISLSAGSEAEAFVGAVHFDAISYQFITGADFATFDKSATLEMAGAAVTETVTNGNFNTIGDGTADDALLPAASWTFDAADTDAVVHGVSALDRNYFAALRAKDASLNFVDLPTADPASNALLIFHKEATTSTYTSADITATASAVNTVSIKVQNKLNNNAALTLKLYADDMLVVSKTVPTTNAASFATYSLSVKAGATAPTLKLVIAMGEGDDEVSGYAWFDTVFFAANTAATVADADLTTDLFELVNDNGDKIMTNNAWSTVGTTTATAKAGFVQMMDYNANAAYAQIEELFKGAQTKYGLLLTASEPAYFGLKQNVATTYTASEFVRITLRIKTRGFAEGEGARIVLNDNNILENVNSQYLTDAELSAEGVSAEMKDGVYYGWRNYYFYVNVGATEAQMTKLAIWLGKGVNPSAMAQGTVLVDYITVETIPETEYLELVDEYDENNVTYFMNVQLSETPDEETEDPSITDDSTGCSETASWVVPSILFAVAIVIAIAGFAIKKIASKPRKKKAVKGTVSYDRRNTITVLPEGGKKTAAPEKTPEVKEEPVEEVAEEATEEATEEVTEEAPAEETPAEDAPVEE